jgi:hypothetical protein
MIGHLSLELARTEADFAEAARLRDSVYRERLGLDPSTWRDEAARDRAGYAFLLRDRGELVGTGRAIRTDSPLCELRMLGRLPTELEDSVDACEVGRIATVRGGGASYGAVMLCLGARWLLDHTALQQYAAYTRMSLVKVYQRVGAVEVGPRFQIAGRGDTEYVVMIGQLADPAAIADQLIAAEALAMDGVRS